MSMSSRSPRTRCAWVGDSPLEIAYHDREWGVPTHDDRELFEFLVLESAQAGLRWSLILQRRAGYREAFAGFTPERVAGFSEERIEALCADERIIRHRQKVEAAVHNARQFLAIQEEFGSFDAYLWRFVDGVPVQNTWTSLAEIPAQTERSARLSKDLKARGFRFIGPTICYAYMQAVGLVNDHVTGCFRHAELEAHAQAG